MSHAKVRQIVTCKPDTLYSNRCPKVAVNEDTIIDENAAITQLEK